MKVANHITHYIKELVLLFDFGSAPAKIRSDPPIKQ